MRTYIARRLLHGLLVLWLVSLAVFSLVRILPGDAVLMQLDQAASPTPETLARARQELGLDRPFLEQYRTWMAGAVRGDLGHSLTSRRPVTQELLKRVSLTSHLVAVDAAHRLRADLGGPRTESEPAADPGPHHRRAAGRRLHAHDALVAAR